MAVRITYIAIAMGGLCGTFAALVGSPSAPTPTSEPLGSPMGNLPMLPIGELGRPAASVRAITSSVAPALVAAPIASSSTTAAPSAVNVNAAMVSNTPTGSSAAPASSAAPVSPSAALTAIGSSPPPSTKETLLRAEMHCDNKDATACIQAARSYEAGSTGITDPEKAAKYRKIALTLWIGQCDRNSATACATLADMYREGRGVPQNAKNAAALLVRTRELCHYNDAPVCHDLPPAH